MGSNIVLYIIVGLGILLWFIKLFSKGSSYKREMISDATSSFVSLVKEMVKKDGLDEKKEEDKCEK